MTQPRTFGMPTISLPILSEPKKASLARHGLKIIEKLSVEEFESAAIAFLNRHNVLHLATCRDNQPRSTTVEYFNKGLTVYILSEGGGKISNLRENPQVSYTVADPYDPVTDFFGAAGLQVWGTASVFRKNDDPDRFAEVYALRQTGESLERQNLAQQAARINFAVISIVPTRISYLNYREGFRRVVWQQNA